MYIKLEVKKIITEACIECLHENYYLVRGIFLVQNIDNFFAAGGSSPAYAQDFRQRLGERGWAVHTWWGQQPRKKEGKVLSKMGDTGGLN